AEISHEMPLAQASEEPPMESDSELAATVDSELAATVDSDKDNLRLWTDKSGTRQIRGELIEIRENTILVRNEFGKVCEQSIALLSDEDAAYVMMSNFIAWISPYIPENFMASDINLVSL